MQYEDDSVLTRTRLYRVYVEGHSFQPYAFHSRFVGEKSYYSDNPAVVRAFADYFIHRPKPTDPAPSKNDAVNSVVFNSIDPDKDTPNFYLTDNFAGYGPALVHALNLLSDDLCRQIRQWVAQHRKSVVSALIATVDDTPALGKDITLTGKAMAEVLNGLIRLDHRAFFFDYRCTTLFVALKCRGIPDKWIRFRMLLPYTPSQARHLKNPPLPREIWQYLYR